MKRKFMLVLLPAFYIILGSYFNYQIGIYSVRTIDPEYMYLICGLNIAEGNMKVGNIDHPGTTLQYIIAASLKTIHYFRASNAPFVEDVLANPEIYLKVVNLILTFLVSFIMFISGFIIYERTRNIWYAIILQFTPFASDVIYSNIGRVTPETLMPLLCILFILLSVKFIHHKDEPEKLKNILLFSLLAAIILALKLTMIFILLIPVFLIKKWRHRFYFIGLTVLIFLLFAIPVTLQLDYFWNWIKGLFIYSGQYGSGEANIIEATEFFPNIINLYHMNRFYFIFTGLFLIIFIVTFFAKKAETNISANRTSLALLLVVLIQVLVLGKHFKPTYFIPALMLLPLMVYLVSEYAMLWLPYKAKKFIPPVIILGVIFMMLMAQRPVMLQLSQHLERINEQKEKAYHYFQNIDSNPKLFIVPQLYGAPVKEYALMTSYQWAGKYKSYFLPYFKKLYPNTYIFYPWDNSLNYWGELPSSEQSSTTYLYIENDNLTKTVVPLIEKYFPGNYSLNEIFFNPETNEKIFRVDSSEKINQ